MSASTDSEQTPPGHDVTQIQADLLNLLNDTGSAPAPAAPPSKAVLKEQAVAAETGCPSCGFTGSWGMGSWCPKCGYFPRIGHSGEVVPDPEETVDELPPALWDLVAGWVWILIGGMAAIVVTSLLIPFVLRDPLQRGGAAVVQMLIGGTLGAISQIRAYILSSRTSENFKFYSIFTSPIAIWRGAFKLLPDSRSAFFMAAWGWTAMLSGGLLVGVHWPVYLKAFADHMREVREAEAAAAAVKGDKGDKKDEKKKDPAEMTFGEFVGEIGKTLTPEEEKPSKMKIKKPKDDNSQDMDDAMNKLMEGLPMEMTAEEGADGAKDPNAEGGGGEDQAEKPLGQRCLVIGYTANASGEVRSLLVAAPLRDGRLRFAAKLPLDSLTNRDLLELRKMLGKIRTRTPACACPFGGVWVNPILQCRILNDGWTSDGRLRNPHIDELILESAQTPARSASLPRLVR